MNTIINPNNNKRYSLFSKKGKQLLKQFIKQYNHMKQIGGYSSIEKCNEYVENPTNSEDCENFDSKFRQCSRFYHPDKKGDSEKFKNLNHWKENCSKQKNKSGNDEEVLKNIRNMLIICQEINNKNPISIETQIEFKHLFSKIDVEGIIEDFNKEMNDSSLNINDLIRSFSILKKIDIINNLISLLKKPIDKIKTGGGIMSDLTNILAKLFLLFHILTCYYSFLEINKLASTSELATLITEHFDTQPNIEANKFALALRKEIYNHTLVMSSSEKQDTGQVTVSNALNMALIPRGNVINLVKSKLLGPSLKFIEKVRESAKKIFKIRLIEAIVDHYKSKGNEDLLVKDMTEIIGDHCDFAMTENNRENLAMCVVDVVSSNELNAIVKTNKDNSYLQNVVQSASNILNYDLTVSRRTTSTIQSLYNIIETSWKKSLFDMDNLIKKITRDTMDRAQEINYELSKIFRSVQFIFYTTIALITAFFVNRRDRRRLQQIDNREMQAVDNYLGATDED